MQSEGQRWIISVWGEDDHAGFVFGCRANATLANPHRRDTYFYTLASAPLHYNCSALTMFVSNISPTSNPVTRIIAPALACQLTKDPGATARI